MSQGLVPITFPIGVAPEIIVNGKNGYLVNSVEDVVRKINFLRAKKMKRVHMAEEAIRTSRLFNSDMLIKKYVDIYHKLENKKGCQAYCS